MVSAILENEYISNLDRFNIGDKIAVQHPEIWKIYKVVDKIPAGWAAKTAIQRGYLKFLQEVDPLIYNVISEVDPTPENGAEVPGVTWFNYKSGEKFTLSTNMVNDKYIWIGDQGTVVIDRLSDKVDITGNGKCIALYQLNKDGSDLSGRYHGQVTGNVKFVPGRIGNAARSLYSYGQILLENLPFTRDTEIVTVSFWLKWKGTNNCMPFGFTTYDIYINGNHIGFNTANGDLYGVKFSKYKNKWTHIVAEFRKGAYGRLWINGEEQELKQIYGRPYFDNAWFSNQAAIFGWRANRYYTSVGYIDQLRIYDDTLENSEIQIIFNEK